MHPFAKTGASLAPIAGPAAAIDRAPNKAMAVRFGSPAWGRVTIACAAFALGIAVAASDALPYRLEIDATGDRAVDAAIDSASLLRGLRDEAPVGPFALVARAESDESRLDSVLRSFGYYDAQILIRIAGRDIEDPGLLPLLEGLPPQPPVDVQVSIVPGPLYRLAVVRLEGPVPEGARTAFALTPGAPARAAEILAAGEAVRLALREDGFALAEVPPPDALVDHDTRTMDVVYRAEPGPRLAQGEIRVIGLDRLREDAALRRLGLTPGEPYSPSRLEAARRDLLASGVLAWARLTPGTEPDAQGRLPLTLEVAERPRRVVRLAGAYSSDEGLTLSASWTHRNLFGGGERLTLRGDVGRMNQTDLNALSYIASGSLRFPDLWVRDLDLRLDLGAVNENLDAYEREAVTAGAVLERRFSERLAGSAGVGFERSRIAQDGPAQDYQLLSLPLTLTYDTTDAPLDPRRGLRLAAQLTPADVLQGEASGFLLGRVGGSAYLDLSRIGWLSAEPDSSVLAGRVALGSIVGAAPRDVPPDWRFYAGGGGSVRGYPFQSIGPRTASGSPAGGDGLLEAGLELRQRIGANWGWVAFADAGAVSEDGIPGTGALAIGLGLGLRYFTPVGPVRVDVAAPLEPREGDSPVALYIGIGQAF